MREFVRRFRCRPRLIRICACVRACLCLRVAFSEMICDAMSMENCLCAHGVRSSSVYAGLSRGWALQLEDSLMSLLVVRRACRVCAFACAIVRGVCVDVGCVCVLGERKWVGFERRVVRRAGMV